MATNGARLQRDLIWPQTDANQSERDECWLERNTKNNKETWNDNRELHLFIIDIYLGRVWGVLNFVSLLPNLEVVYLAFHLWHSNTTAIHLNSFLLSWNLGLTLGLRWSVVKPMTSVQCINSSNVLQLQCERRAQRGGGTERWITVFWNWYRNLVMWWIANLLELLYLFELFQIRREENSMRKLENILLSC